MTRRTTRSLPRRKSAEKQAADTTENLLLLQQELDTVRREYGKLQQAIYEAAQVQRRMCAPRELAWGEFEIAGESFPVRHLSGDFFKVVELGSALGLILGDIAGKGLTAGIWQAHLMDVMQRCARAYAHPCDAIAGVNRELCQDLGERPITALFFARLDPERGELVYCNAGLPAPLVLRHDKSVEQLEEGGPMLGALNEATYGSGTVRMDAGDMLLAYSDGLTECMNSKEEEFETRRLIAATKAFSGASASQVLFSTLAAVLDFADTCPPADDLTLLVVRRHAKAGVHDSNSEKDFAAPRRRVKTVARARAAAN
ncbi:MAG: serine/threonine-protein phosphatase [Acidobacteriota bacterium]|nr:serine/threonine-protein phosphatase [Acidobacteriota bacterium]